MVGTIGKDESENQDVCTIRVVSNVNNIELLFVTVDPTINIDKNGYNNIDDPTALKIVLFVALPPEQDNKDSYVPCKESVPIVIHSTTIDTVKQTLFFT